MRALSLPHFLRATMQAKLISAFLAVALIPLAVLGFLHTRAIRLALVNEANEKLLGAAIQTASHLDAFLRTNLNAVRTEAQLPDLMDYLRLPASQRQHSPKETEVVDILRALSRRDPLNIASYALLDQQGWNVIDTFTADIGMNTADRSYFRVPLSTGLPSVSPIQFSPEVPGRASLYFSSPVRDTNGKTAGILAARYNAAVLQQLLIQTDGLAGEQSFAMLLDENYVRLAHGMAPDLLFTPVVPLDSSRRNALQTARRWPDQTMIGPATNLSAFAQDLATAMRGEPGFDRRIGHLWARSRHGIPGNAGKATRLTGRYPDQGPKPYFTTQLTVTGDALNSVAVAPLETQPWLVVFVQPQGVFLAPIEAQTRRSLILAAVLVGVVVGAAVLVAYTLAAPVVRLTQVAKQVAAGDLTVQASVASRDEIGTLAVTFNSMTLQLRHMMAGLEEQIAERTQAEHVAQAHATRLHTLATLSQVISSSMSTENVLDDITKAAAQLMDAALVFFWGVDETAQKLEVRTFSDPVMGADFPQRSFAFGEGAVGWVATHRCMLTIPDVSTDARFVHQAWWRGHQLQSFVGVPILHEDALLAVLMLGGTAPFQLGPVEHSLLESFVAQATSAIRNVQLFQKIRTQTDALAQANTILHREITQRRRTEEQLRQRTTQVEAINAELDAFAYSISHDLRAPLRSIAGFSQALMEDYPAQLDSKALEFLTRMQHASQRMGQMITDLLTLSRATRGELRWEQVDLSTLAATIMAELSEQAPDRQVSVEIAPQVTAQGDPQLLRVVLENLLHNAWKFTSKHPTATIAFGTRCVDGDTVYFVRDDGAGFDMDYVEKLFGIFQRLHAVTEFEGTGIGLATVIRLIHRHGGRVWAEGVKEQGATFSFTLWTVSEGESQTWQN